jgi:hypothetical protein
MKHSFSLSLIALHPPVLRGSGGVRHIRREGLTQAVIVAAIAKQTIAGKTLDKAVARMRCASALPAGMLRNSGIGISFLPEKRFIVCLYVLQYSYI